jgi:hypothetical protein
VQILVQCLAGVDTACSAADVLCRDLVVC